MHACLLHIYAHAFTLFIILMLITMGIGHGLVYVHLCLDKRPIRRYAYVIYSAMLLFPF
jgi:hypothetical protein